uniref:AlNc14C25G2522 protein n=1 Tax=Albugo laibachii Nc14 TaxID=890382 RepID=F0W6N4_9STRA|nr:AlNc14C25G2522 [Albugo laibachii Nc14]|eukprot:CCA16779.1 AlNc14C25G2522 [Albugo laibachii Nc14]
MLTQGVYFGSATCPQQLVRVGKVCEQIAYRKELYPVLGKNARSQRSDHVLLTAVHTVWMWESQQPNKSTKKAPIGASEQAEVPEQELEKNAVERVERKLPDQNSLEFNSTRPITPPYSSHLHPTSLPIFQVEAGTAPSAPQDGDVTMQLARPRALPGLVTSNYFLVFSSMEVELDEVNAVANPAHGNRFQIISFKARIPKQVAASKEAAHFYRKRHTTVVKTEQPARVGEFGELMEVDSTNALQRIKPDKLVQADSQIKIVR